MRGETSPQLGYLGMKLLLLSLSVLFAASLVGFLVIRWRAGVWPPEGAPQLPSGLWWSTAIILLSSWVLRLAQRRFNRGEAKSATPYLIVCLALALTFLANQVLNWKALGPLVRVSQVALYTFSFFMLTVLHALHVVGGVVSLVVVTMKAGRGSLTSAGLAYTAIYWHFLTVVWMVIFSVLKLLF